MTRRAASLTILAVLAVIVGTVSAWVLWLGDDIDYGYFITDSIWDSAGRFSSFANFWASQANHYWHVNGRFVAHTLVALFCGVLGQPVFALCNGLVYGAFVWLILRCGGVRRPLQSPQSVLACAALVLLVFVTKMMPTTQIGFVWMLALNLLWLRCFAKSPRWHRWWQIALLTALSIVAGNGQEALTLGLGAALGIWWLRRRCAVGTARTAMLIGYWVGVLALCLSPGTRQRASADTVDLASSLLYGILSLRAFYLLIIVGAWVWWRRGLSPLAVWRHNALICNAMAVLFVFNAVIGVYSNRQLMGIEVLALVLTWRLLPRHRFGWPLTAIFVAIAAAWVTLQMILAGRVRTQFSDLLALHAQTTPSSGIVYYDRTQASQCPFLHEFRYYEEIVGPGASDTHHSMQKLVRDLMPSKRIIKVWPTYKLTHRITGDTVVSYAPGHFLAVTVAWDARLPMAVHRSMLTGHRDTDSINTRRSVVHGPNWAMVLVTSQRPFASLDTVILIPETPQKSLPLQP